MKTRYMLILICFSFFAFILFSTGCCQIERTTTLPNGTVLKDKYTRLGDQRIDSFMMTVDPNTGMPIVEFNKQESLTDIAFKLGAASVNVGGGGTLQ